MTTSPTQTLDSFPKPPRRLRGSGGWKVWIGRLFIIPHTLVGVGYGFFLVFLIFWAVLGTKVPGLVTGGYTSRGSKGGTTYNLLFSYVIDGVTNSDKQSVGTDAYSRLRPDGLIQKEFTPVTILHFQIGPIRYAGILDAKSRLRNLGETGLFALFWNAIVSIFFWLLWVIPWQTRLLYQNGIATLAAATTKRSEPGKNGTKYLANIAFEHPTTHERLEQEVTVHGKDVWERIESGQIVTALCHPQKIKRVVVAEWGPYKIVE